MPMAQGAALVTPSDPGFFSKFPADNASKSLQKSRAARARDNHTLSYLVLLMYQLTILQLLSRLYRLKIIARALRDRCDR